MALRPVEPDVSFPELEERRLAVWDEGRIFERSVSDRSAERCYAFYDGPPFATGLPHYGHLVASILKDVVPRYWTMRGFRVERRWGWDCHGLPVENETERALGLKEKGDIERFGVHAFNEECRRIVLRYTAEWKRTIRRLGRWVDFEGGYRTMDRDYMESVWWVFGRLWEKDLVYQGFRIQPYCPRCGTPLSNFELNQPGGYRMRQDPSVIVRVAWIEREDAEFWIWTTTPWTLPANTALAVGADIDYVEVRRPGGRNVILAEAQLARLLPGVTGVDVVRRMKGAELAGVRYEPPFRFQPEESEAQYTVLVGDFVSTEEGTGIVHMSPAFGEDDFALGAAHGLPVFRPVGGDGRFTELVPPYEGQSVKDADRQIVLDLKRAGALVDQRTIDHSYPHCYRCDSPLLYMALETWFVRIEPIKQAMLRANESVRWVPEAIGRGRFGNWLEDARDWNFSRSRYWGTPIPLWICDRCERSECLSSAAELESRVGRAVPDLHKHFVDELAWDCACGGRMQRIPEIFDCWFESGSMPYAQVHYPFDEQGTKLFERSFPADFIAEGLDQTRGWFYTLTVLGAALFGRSPFKNVIVNGIVLAEDGEKMSKRKRNYPDPGELLERYGSDALRIYLLNSVVVYAKDLRFSEVGIQEHVRSVLLPLWNAYSFLTRYAAIDAWEPDGSDPDPAANELDGWILSRLQTLVGTVESHMAAYELFRVVPALVGFVDDLNNWYIRRSRRRFWKQRGAGEGDADKRNAYRTLHRVLLDLSRALAPFLPFVAEEIYENLSGGKRKDSVHLDDYPTPEERWIDAELERRMDLARLAVGLGRGLRARHQVRVRQPLSRMVVVAPSDADRAALERVSGIVAEELNVRRVVVSGDEAELVTYSARPNLKLLGPRFGKALATVRSEIEALTEADLARVVRGEGIASRGVPGLVFDEHSLIIDRSSREGTVVDTAGGVTVALDLELSEELRREGLAREVIHRIQNQRKEQGLQLDDRIRVSVGASGALADAVLEHWALIAGEVLGQPAAGLVESLDAGQRFDIEGEELLLKIEVAGDR